MGYDKVQSLSLKKDGTLTVRSAPNNISPVRYNSHTITLMDDESVMDRLQYVFGHLASGDWQMNPSNKSLVYYYFLKAIEEVEDKKDIMIRHGRVRTSEDDPRAKVFIEDCYNDVLAAFQMNWLKGESVSLSAKKYAVITEKGRWMHGKRKYGYSYSMTMPKTFPIVKAMMLRRLYGGEIREMDEK